MIHRRGFLQVGAALTAGAVVAKLSSGQEFRPFVLHEKIKFDGTKLTAVFRCVDPATIVSLKAVMILKTGEHVDLILSNCPFRAWDMRIGDRFTFNVILDDHTKSLPIDRILVRPVLL